LIPLGKPAPNALKYFALGPVKIKKRIEDESDMDESGEHHIEFFKA
jgi:hypothetical protein